MKRIKADSCDMILVKNRAFTTMMNIELKINPYLLFATLTMPTPCSLFSFINPYESNLTSRRFSWFSIIVYLKQLINLFIGASMVVLMAVRLEYADFKMNEVEQDLLDFSFASFVLCYSLSEYQNFRAER